MFNLFKTFRKWRATVNYKRAVRLADETYERTKVRQYVIKGNNHSLVVIDKYALQGMKARGVMDKNTKVIDLQRNCFYATPDAIGRDKLTPDEVEARKQMCLNVMSR